MVFQNHLRHRFSDVFISIKIGFTISIAAAISIYISVAVAVADKFIIIIVVIVSNAGVIRHQCIRLIEQSFYTTPYLRSLF